MSGVTPKRRTEEPVPAIDDVCLALGVGPRLVLLTMQVVLRPRIAPEHAVRLAWGIEETRAGLCEGGMLQA